MKNKNKSFQRRIKFFKNSYTKALHDKNLILIKSIEMEVDSIIERWTYVINNKINDENKKNIQEQFKNNAIIFLNKIRSDIKMLENEFGDQITEEEFEYKIKIIYQKYGDEIVNLFNECYKQLDNHSLNDAKKILEQIAENFEKWKNVMILNPSIKSPNYNNLYDKYMNICKTYSDTKQKEEMEIQEENEIKIEENIQKINKENIAQEKVTEIINNENIKTVDVEVMNDDESNNKDDSSINWTCAAISGVIGAALGAAVTYFIMDDD